MKKTLIQVGYGVRKYYDGRYRMEDDTTICVDGRSLQALFDRNLIFWRGLGGSTHQIHLMLTEIGKEIFDTLLDGDR